MKKPYIYFCGDKQKCNELADSCKKLIKSVFITDKNADNYLVSPKSHPALICLIFSQDTYANNILYEKIYSYSAYSGCPVHIDGSRRNIDTVIKHAKGANIQRSSEKLMTKTFSELYEFARNNPDSEFALLKARFENVAVISDKASSLAFCENKTSSTGVKSRLIVVAEKGGETELEKLENTPLSQIITDAPLNEKSLELFCKVSKSEAPAILLDCRTNYGKKFKAHYLDMRTDGKQLSALLENYKQKKSKRLYLKNK